MSYYDDYNRAREALTYIDPNTERLNWVKIGTALKNEFGEDGKELFQEFSQRGDNYKQRDFEHTWKSLDPSTQKIGTVYFFAKKGGYQYNQHQTHTPETPEQKAAREADRAAREAEMKAQKEISDKQNLEEAQDYYNKSPAADNSHPYLQKKGIENPEGLKHYKTNNTHILYIPIFNKDEELQGVQRIFNDGNKGIVGKVSGGSFTIGDLNQAAEKGVILAEGYATAYALHKHSDMPVVVGFNSHNIVHIAENLKEKLPEGTKLIVAADNDVHLVKKGRTNEGLKGANAAAMAYGDNAMVMFPPEYPAHIWQEATKDGKTPTDFDDAQRWLGSEAVKQTIDEAREKMGLTMQQEQNQSSHKKTAEELEHEETMRIQKELWEARIAAREERLQEQENNPTLSSVAPESQENSQKAFQEVDKSMIEPEPKQPEHIETMSEEAWAALMSDYSSQPMEEEYDRYQDSREQSPVNAEPTLPLPTEELRQQTVNTVPELDNQATEQQHFSSVENTIEPNQHIEKNEEIKQAEEQLKQELNEPNLPPPTAESRQHSTNIEPEFPQATEPQKQPENFSNTEEYEKKEIIEKAIKESDLKEQVQYGEAPDTPREQAEKAAILSSSPEFRQPKKKAEPEQEQPTKTEPTPKPQQNQQQTEEKREFKIPENVSKQYEAQGNNDRKLLDKETHKLAIDASSDNVLKTRKNDAKTIQNMLEIAENNGWTSVKIKGSNEFKREEWLQASLKGLEVNGYKPTEQDKKLLETRKERLEKNTNSITNDNETPKQAEREKPIHEATGKLVAHGVAPYPNSEKGSKTYYADIQTADGTTQRLWGKGIQAALQNSNSREGDNIHLAKTGNDGKQNTWKAEVIQTAAQQKIETARASGNPETLKAAQQSFAKEHLAARSAQILQQNHEKVQQVAGVKPEQNIPKPPQARETTKPKKSVSHEITH